MTDEKLVQSPECEDHVCPQCSSLLHPDCGINIETGSIELVWLCYYCGHTE